MVKLRGNSFVKHEGSKVCMRSYDTPICDYDVNTATLYVTPFAYEYSNTTCRHISVFINKYVPAVACDNVTYAMIKDFVTYAGIGESKIFDGLTVVVL